MTTKAQVTRNGVIVATITDLSASESLTAARSASRIGDVVTLITAMPNSTIYEHFDVVKNQRQQKTLRFAGQETK